MRGSKPSPYRSCSVTAAPLAAAALVTAAASAWLKLSGDGCATTTTSRAGSPAGNSLTGPARSAAPGGAGGLGVVALARRRHRLQRLGRAEARSVPLGQLLEAGHGLSGPHLVHEVEGPAPER